jgi:hypothetical protein
MQGIVLVVDFPSIEGHKLINLFELNLEAISNFCRFLSIGKQLEAQMTPLVV